MLEVNAITIKQLVMTVALDPPTKLKLTVTVRNEVRWGLFFLDGQVFQTMCPRKPTLKTHACCKFFNDLSEQDGLC